MLNHEDMLLPHNFRVTKYDPADRDEHGHYIGDQDVDSDHGRVETAYLKAVAAFAADAAIDRLVIREPGLPGIVHFDVAGTIDDFGLNELFPTRPADFHDGAEVPLDVGLELVRIMLRGNGAWCRLEVEGVFYVDVGYDQYLYLGSKWPCEKARLRTRELGLFPEDIDNSPYRMPNDDEGIQRPADEDFWAKLRWAVNVGDAGTMEETYIENRSRWHRLTRDSIDTVRAGLAPRARLEVWPDLSTDIDAALAALPDEGLVECVWEDQDGHLHNTVVDEGKFSDLRAHVSAANAIAILSMYADERVPLFTAVTPDPDGVLRARWQTEPTPSDRTWAFLKTLRRGEVVTGTVTRIPDFLVTFVDLGGFEAMINIPELSWDAIDHPSDVVSVGQVITAKVLDIDLSRERVSLSLKALHEKPG